MSRPTTAADEGRLADMLAEEQVCVSINTFERCLGVKLREQDSYARNRPGDLL
jgi:hypothetical protein